MQKLIITAVLIFVCSASATLAQTTAFNYQGHLTSNSSAANGSYDFQFALYDVLTGGAQIGSTLTKTAITVTGGVFTISLDFGSNAFPGTDRYLEIAVKKPIDAVYVTLAPRQQITSSPYSIRTLSATFADSLSSACVACVTNAQINSVDGSKISGKVAIANGGTGSTTQNFVDLSSNQNVGGNKLFTGSTQFNASLNLNDNLLLFRQTGDTNHAILYSSNVNGLEFRGFSGFKWATGSSGASQAMFLDPNGNLNLTGTYTGNGSGLTSLNASNITSGTLNSARIGSGSGNYIQNILTTATAQSGANFHIDGSGRIDSQFSVSGALKNGDTVSVISSSGRPFALNGYSSFNGAGVYGEVSAGNTQYPAIFGLYKGSNPLGAGVVGSNTNTTGAGIIAVGPTTGLSATVTDQTGTPTQALYTDNGFIVRVNYWDGTTQYKIQGNGVVSTLVQDTAQQTHVMFAPEAPEVLFEDYGVGKLVNGRAKIELDPVFSTNITVNDSHPLRVFIQLEGDCNGVFVTSKTSTGFEVIELANGQSNVQFSWHVVANRADEELKGSGTQVNGITIRKRVSRYADLRAPVQKEASSTAPAIPAKSPVPERQDNDGAHSGNDLKR